MSSRFHILRWSCYLSRAHSISCHGDGDVHVFELIAVLTNILPSSNLVTGVDILLVPVPEIV